GAGTQALVARGATALVLAAALVWLARRPTAVGQPDLSRLALGSAMVVAGFGAALLVASAGAALAAGGAHRQGSVVESLVAAQAGGRTVLISKGNDGTPGNSSSTGPHVAEGGGYVAFTSGASNLVPGDTNDAYDVFVHELATGETSRVSVATDGSEATGDSTAGGISADGRYVVFESFASNLVAGDTNREPDVFLHDRRTGLTMLVSAGLDGAPADAGASAPAISANGRVVAFESDSTNLVPDDGNGVRDVFAWDLALGRIVRVSVSSAGAEAAAPSHGAAVSGDGALVAFTSDSRRLVDDDLNGVADVFVRDLAAGETALVSRATSGAQADDECGEAAISSGGEHVAFTSLALTLDNVGSVWRSAFVRSLADESTVRVSVSAAGSAAEGNAEHPVLTADGRLVAFSSEAANLVPDDSNSDSDVFVNFIGGGITVRASVWSSGEEGDGASRNPSISGDGRWVAFDSRAVLASGVPAGVRQVYVRDLAGGPIPTATTPPDYAHLPWAGLNTWPGAPTPTATPTRPTATASITPTPSATPTRTPRPTRTPPPPSATPRPPTATPKSAPLP
ncbi:MAG: TolB family protein, partial [Anaerolineae bacterium]